MDQIGEDNRDDGISRQVFIHSDIDSKLVHMFDELKVIRNDQLECARKFEAVGQAMAFVGNKLEQVCNVTNAQTEFMRALAYKSIDIEARSRRNNLIFRGFVENKGENCFEIIRNFMANHLDLDPRGVYLARAHRLGRFDPQKQYQRRPIIVNFRDFSDIETIMSNFTMLKGSPFSIDYDYPKEIQDARSKLWPLYKQLKKDACRDDRVHIAYPAKLIKNGRLVRDELPDWQKYTSSNRLTFIDQVSVEPAVPTCNNSNMSPQRGDSEQDAGMRCMSRSVTGSVDQQSVVQIQDNMHDNEQTAGTRFMLQTVTGNVNQQSVSQRQGNMHDSEQASAFRSEQDGSSADVQQYVERQAINHVVEHEHGQTLQNGLPEHAAEIHTSNHEHTAPAQPTFIPPALVHTPVHTHVQFPGFNPMQFQTQLSTLSGFPTNVSPSVNPILVYPNQGITQAGHLSQPVNNVHILSPQRLTTTSESLNYTFTHLTEAPVGSIQA